MKKLFSILLVITLCMSVFSACTQSAVIPSAAITASPKPTIEKTPEPTQRVFLGNDADAYNELIDAFKNRDYSAALKIVEPYKDKPDEGRIYELLNQASQKIINCEIRYDDFSETSTIQPPIGAIYSSNFYLMLMSDNSIYGVFSTKDDDWVFWDSIKIKVSTDEFITYNFNYYDINRDVWNSGTCYESIVIPFDDKISDLEKIVYSNNLMIRFSGDRIYDVNPGPEQIDSLRSMLALYKIHKEIDNLL